MPAKKIRDDLEGVVYIDGHVLKAGDSVPAGVTLGDHLFKSAKAEPEETPTEPDK